MTAEKEPKEGRLNLGERVHVLEYETAKLRKELKRIKADGSNLDDLAAWVGQRIAVTARGYDVEEVMTLVAVRKYSLVVLTTAGSEILMKNHIQRVRLVA